MENNENNGATTQDSPNTVADERNYKQEYENQKLEIERLKNAISKTNSENAEYKRQEVERKKKELDSLPEVERLTKELEAERNAREAEKAEIARLKLEKEFSANGFSAEETAKLIDGNFAPKDIADIIKARVDEGVKSAKAEATKSSTAETLLGNGTANKGDSKSDFQKHQESKQTQSTKVEL